MKNINHNVESISSRRNLVKLITLLSAGTFFLNSKSTQSQDLPGNSEEAPVPDRMVLTTEISNNHRHAIEMTTDDIVRHYRKTLDGSKAEIDMKGESRHTHSIFLDKEQLLKIIQGEKVEVDSEGGAHTHFVSLTLVD